MTKSEPIICLISDPFLVPNDVRNFQQSWKFAFKGLGQRYPNKNGHFDNAENRKITEHVPEISTDDSVTVLLSSRSISPP